MAEDSTILTRTFIIIGQRICRIGEGGDGGMQLLNAQLRIQNIAHTVHSLHGFVRLGHA
ncbi:hypothetical protein D3C85_1744810 [compost metagenome]